MANLTPEDQELFATSVMFRKAAYGEEDEGPYPFLGLQVICWISGLISGLGLMYLVMR